MTQQTKIEWTDFSVNFWEGCQKVGPGCDHCYAEARDMRFTGGSHWGPGAPRRKVKGGIAKLQKINRNAPAFFEQHGRWPRIFCSSLSDVFDNAVDTFWRADALQEISLATYTRPQLLTKRVGNVEKMLPSEWSSRWPAHVGLMITVVNQEEADRDIPKLLDLKARLGIPWVGLSMEPLLGPVTLSGITTYTFRKAECLNALSGRLSGMFGEYAGTISGLDWVICGGESGPNARPMHPRWASDICDQCEMADVPFLFKQWGEWGPCDHLEPGVKFGCFNDAGVWVYPAEKQFALQRRQIMLKAGKKRAGRMLDGRTWDGFPEALKS